MSSLETRVPPAVVLLVAGALAYGLDVVGPGWSPVGAGVDRAIGLGVAVVGIGVAGAGAVAFRRAGTTVDPMRIDAVSTVVTGGIYRITRNPMYLGMALVLVGWCVALGTVPGLVVSVPLLVGYLTRFQIAPEERMLEEKFGEAYREFRDRVRRWL